MKNAPENPGRENHCCQSLIFRLTAGLGTLRFTQVAGLHRAVPSTTLDKVFNCKRYYSRFFHIVKIFCLLNLFLAFLFACYILLCYNSDIQQRGDVLMADTIRFGSILREQRNKARLSQQALAELMNVSRNTVINWEADKNRPDYEVLPRLCEVLGLSLGELFGTGFPDDADSSERRLLQDYRRLSPSGKRMAGKMLSVMLDEELRAREEELVSSFRIFAEYYSAAAAGTGCEFGDLKPMPVILRKNSRNEHADAIVRVCGDSMEPVYRDGDFLYFRYTDDAGPGSDVVCSTEHGAIVKRVASDGTLCSVNSARPFGMKSEADNIHILGIVTGLFIPDDKPEDSDRDILQDIFHDELYCFRKQYQIGDWD